MSQSLVRSISARKNQFNLGYYYRCIYSRQFHSQDQIIAPNCFQDQIIAPNCFDLSSLGFTSSVRRHGSHQNSYRFGGNLIPGFNPACLLQPTNGFASVSNLGSDESNVDNGDKKPKVVYKKPIDFTKIDANLLPTVMIIGRPNVGKSALYNRLIRRREALVYNTPDDHVTRDIREGVAKLADLRFNVLEDSAGIETEVSSGTILGRTTAMTANVLARTQFAVLIIDVRAGLHPLDLEVGKSLRKHAPQIKPIVVMNKSESISMIKDVLNDYYIVT